MPDKPSVSPTWKYVAVLAITIIGALVCVIATLVREDRNDIKKTADDGLAQGRLNASDIRELRNAILNVASKQDVAELREAEHKDIETLLVKLMDRTSKNQLTPGYPGKDWKPE